MFNQTWPSPPWKSFLNTQVRHALPAGSVQCHSVNDNIQQQPSATKGLMSLLCVRAAHLTPCISLPSCQGTQKNNTSPFSLQQLPTPNCVRMEVFIPITIRIVLFLIHKGSLKVSALRINTGLSLKKHLHSSTWPFRDLLFVTQGASVSCSVFCQDWHKSPKKLSQNYLQFGSFTAHETQWKVCYFLKKYSLDS